jgi:hypothetical protein
MRFETVRERSTTLKEKDAIVSPERYRAYKEPPYSTVFEALEAVERSQPADQSSGDIRNEVEWYVKVQRYVEAKIAERLAAPDQGEPESSFDVAHSNTDWMRSTFRMSSNAAYAQIRTARSLYALPATRDALEEGAISSQHAGVISRCIDQAQKADMDPLETESLLLEAARGLDPGELKDHFSEMRYRANQGAGVVAEEDVRRKSWVRLWKPWHGEWFRLEGDWTPRPARCSGPPWTRPWAAVPGTTIATGRSAVPGR